MSASQVFAVIALGLFIKHFATTCIQAYFRLRSREFPRPEDAAYWKGTVGDHPKAVLAQRALRNDMENVPYFLALTAALLAVGGDPEIVMIYGSIYVITRCLHAVFYIWPRQPLRNRVFQLGLYAAFAECVHIVIRLSGM